MKKNLQIENLRKENKLTQDQLSDLLGISRQTISEWERGISYPSVDKLLSLSKIFNVSLDYIITGENFEQNKCNFQNCNYQNHKEMKKILKEKGFTSKEINLTLNSKEYQYTALNRSNSFIFGESNKYYVSTKEEANIGNTIVVASAGAGKTRSILKPNIAQAIKRGESIIINDVDGHIHDSCKDLLKKNGYEIQYIDFQITNTKINFLADLPDDKMEAEKYIKCIFNNLIIKANREEYEKININSLYIMFRTFIRYYLYCYKESENKNLYEFFTLVHNKNLDELIDLISKCDEEIVINDYKLLSIFKETELKELYLILAISYENYLKIWYPKKDNNKELYKEEHKVSDIFSGKKAVFLITSHCFSSLNPITLYCNLYLEMFIYLIHESYIENSNNIFLFLDEFIHYNYPMKNIHYILKNNKSLKITTMIILQSLQQITKQYNTLDYQDFLKYFDNIVYLNCSNDLDVKILAKYFNIHEADLRYMSNENMYVKRNEEVIRCKKIKNIEEIFDLQK